jgi:hypothetical protein
MAVFPLQSICGQLDMAPIFCPGGTRCISAHRPRGSVRGSLPESYCKGLTVAGLALLATAQLTALI